MKLTLDLVKNALSNSNGNLNQSAEFLNVKYVTLYYWVKKYKIPYEKAHFDYNSKEQLSEAYARLGSLSLVAKEIGGTKDGVRHAMLRFGLLINSPKINNINHDFFKTDSEKVFYWAGFWGADGCIGTRKNSLRRQLSLALKVEDKSHIEKFCKDVEFDGKIGVYWVRNSKRHPNWKDTQKAEIKITSNTIISDLERFNIVPRKSLIYQFPEWLVEHPLVNHYMRGYLDGDGSFYLQKYKTKADQICCAVRGTTEFLTIYRSILERKCDLEVRERPIRINSDCGVLDYGGNGIVAKIAKYLYKDATIWLDRKHSIISHLL